TVFHAQDGGLRSARPGWPSSSSTGTRTSVFSATENRHGVRITSRSSRTYREKGGRQELLETWEGLAARPRAAPGRATQQTPDGRLGLVAGPGRPGPLGFAGEDRGSMARLGCKKGGILGGTTVAPGHRVVPNTGEVVAARSSASASFVRWWTRTTQPPPVRRASSGCIRKTVGDNHGIGELSSQRFSVPSCGRTSVTGSGRLRGVLAHKHPSSDICGVSQLRRSGLVAFCRPKA